MYPNPQYDFDWGPDGPLAPLHERSASPDYPVMVCPPIGWVPLVLNLNADLSALLPDYVIAQVKEKFGELRYYIESFGVDRGDPRVALARELISAAEAHSKWTCQICGTLGSFRPELAWHATLCDKHAS